MWHEGQNAFAMSLDQPDLSLKTVKVQSRVDVYRNNVMVGLIDAVAANYPVIQALLGDEFFRQVARDFVSEHKPSSPVLLAYGNGFAEFLQQHHALRDYPYLHDVALLEWAWHQAYHGENRLSAGIDLLADVEEDQLDRLVLEMHPTLQTIHSDWPIVSIWEAHQDGVDTHEALANLAQHGENAIVVRPELDVQVLKAEDCFFDFVHALSEGMKLGPALATLNRCEDVDIPAHLEGLFTSGCVVARG